MFSSPENVTLLVHKNKNKPAISSRTLHLFPEAIIYLITEMENSIKN